MIIMKTTCRLFTLPLFSLLLSLSVTFHSMAMERRVVSKDHPRLFGTVAELKKIAEQRPQEYQRMKAVALNPKSGDYYRMMSIALVNAIEPDPTLAREAVDMAMKRINAPIVTGHTPFGSILAYCGIVYDYCYNQWTPEERQKFIDYLNLTVATNVNEERSVFHNGWYGYKNWGYGIGAYATYHENPNAPKILHAIEQEFVNRAAPALELSGAGGGFAEGYYINYWIYEWVVFCDVALRCEGVDYFAMAPQFFNYRAIAGMFEMFPRIETNGSRRAIPMGDGGKLGLGGERDKTLNSRRILASHFRDDPAHQAVFTFDEGTPVSSIDVNAYKDFLWRDPSISKVDLSKFKLSHYSSGPGHVYARSSWENDATYFFFKCGNRYTAHQHLDNGHFIIYKEGELTEDGGHYDGYGSTIHDVNYHLRTIAHNTIRVIDPNESWALPGGGSIRSGKVTANDGGQHHNLHLPNGGALDVNEWNMHKELLEIGKIHTFEEKGDFIFIKADCSKSYSSKKLERFVRQIVYLRPGTFIIVDEVRIKNPSFKTIWNLQAMKKPEKTPNGLWTWRNGNGRLFVQTLLPEQTHVELFCGDDIYTINGINYMPIKENGPAPECRMEISPVIAKSDYLFVHVLQATEAGIKQVPLAKVNTSGKKVQVSLESKRTFDFEIQ